MRPYTLLPPAASLCAGLHQEFRRQAPTLIVWGTGDKLFPRKWANWLRDTIPGADKVLEIDGARMFFPDERAGELTAALRRHWDSHP